MSSENTASPEGAANGGARPRVLEFASGDGWGGAERALTLFVAGLRASRRVDVEVLLANEGALAKALRELGVPVTVIAERGVSPLSYARAVRRFVGERRFAALHVHRYKEIVIGSLLPARSRGRLVVTVHGLEPRSHLTFGSALLVWGALWGARLRGAQFAAVSEELRRRLARGLGSRRVVRIPNPMPPPTAAPARDLRSALGWPADRPVVLFAGRLEEVKGPDLLLEIAAAGDARPGFVLLGSGSMESELRRRATAMGLGDRVAFLGAVPDAMAYLPQADVLALPSRHEGMPMVVLEAAACLVPVVAFDVGGIPELLGDGRAARRVPPGDVRAFRRALDEVLGGRGEIEADLRRWAGEMRGRYGLGATAAAYLDLLLGAPAGEPGPA
jgi:glycosyltransferase involved in cell wall biosynthesis